MKKYGWIVFFRGFEIISRFLLLGQWIKIFTLTQYGKISYEIAFYQFIASVLFSGSLQAMSRYSVENYWKQKVLFTTLTGVFLFLFVGMYLFDGSAAFIFLFYSILYLLNGWYGTHQNQVFFSFMRSSSFIVQVLFFNLVNFNDHVDQAYTSFGVASLALIACFPFRSLSLQMLPMLEWTTYFKFQAHNVSYQLTKIAERWTMQFLLGDMSFGLYSTIRDLVNAANLTFFTPIYQTSFKKLAQGSNYRPLLRLTTSFCVAVIAVGLPIVYFASPLILKILAAIGIKKFVMSDMILIVVLLSLDFYRSVYMMIYEAKHQFRTLFKSHILDFSVQGLACLLHFVPGTPYLKLGILIFGRLFSIDLFFYFNEKKLSAKA